jgi:hypothetical protein
MPEKATQKLAACLFLGRIISFLLLIVMGLHYGAPLICCVTFGGKEVKKWD